MKGRQLEPWHHHPIIPPDASGGHTHGMFARSTQLNDDFAPGQPNPTVSSNMELLHASAIGAIRFAIAFANVTGGTLVARHEDHI